MSGHRPKPVVSSYGRSIDAYLNDLRAWNSTPADTKPKGPATPGGLTVDQIIAAMLADQGGVAQGGPGGSGGLSLAEEMRMLEEKYKWDSKLELEVLEAEWNARGKHDVKLENLSHENKLKFLRTEITLTKDMKLELMVKQHGLDLIMQNDAQAFEELKQATQNEWQGSQNELDRKEQQADREQVKELAEKERELKRFESVQNLRGRDPVRAALMAMGAGDAGDTVAGQFGGMDSLVMDGKDIGEGLKTTTESALRGIEGLGGEALTLGDQGVTGLRDVEKAGRSFVQGSDATQTLISSAQGVGSGKQAGVNEEAVAERIASITPKGFDFKPAAEGAGLSPVEAATTPAAVARRRGQPTPTVTEPTATEPIQENTVYQAGEAGPEALVVGADKKLEKIIPVGAQVNASTTGLDNMMGRTQPYNPPQGDALIDMFNDPELTLNRSNDVNQMNTEYVNQMNTEMARGEMARIDYNMSGPRAALLAEQQGNMELRQYILKLDAAGKPIPREILEQLQSQASGLRPSTSPRSPTNIQEQRQLEIAEMQRRQQYLASLPPAQQAALRQTGQRLAAEQQNQLTNSLTPETIQKLMTLINNPNREVNNNLQEVLPQLRDGAGNVTAQPSQNLARVV